MPGEPCSCNPELKTVILDRIANKGKITFAEFMDLALYFPGLGYYTSPDRKIGKEGDYYTSSCVHPLFGAILAKQIREFWDILGRTDGFAIVEFGAGTGYLARDVLSSLERSQPEFFDAASYTIVEASPSLVQTQQELLTNLPPGKAQWAAGIPEDIVGCVISNELVDAFPVHRVKQMGDGLLEIYVAAQGDRFVETLDAPSTPEIEAYLRRLEVQLGDGQEAEVNLAALRWLDTVAGALRRGFVLTIDYGYQSGDLYGPRFPRGTLLGYHCHQVSGNPYAAVGRQDLTAHVNFSALQRWGEDFGLVTTGFTNQMKFLLALGVVEELTALSQSDSVVALRGRLAAKTLFMPGGMGETFKVLIQHKGLASPFLTGLRSPW